MFLHCKTMVTVNYRTDLFGLAIFLIKIHIDFLGQIPLYENKETKTNLSDSLGDLWDNSFEHSHIKPKGLGISTKDFAKLLYLMKELNKTEMVNYVTKKFGNTTNVQEFIQILKGRKPDFDPKVEISNAVAITDHGYESRVIHDPVEVSRNTAGNSHGKDRKGHFLKNYLAKPYGTKNWINSVLLFPAVVLEKVRQNFTNF